MKPILKWQYEQMAKTLLLIQGHGSDPDCPCASEGEMCMRKHLLEVEALAQETIPMDDDKKHVNELWTLIEEAKALREDEERALCGKNRQQTTDLAEWSREWRKKFEGWSLACQYVPAKVKDSVLEDDIAVLEIPSPFGWPGGKKHLAARIVQVIPAHKTYVEPFAGAASVFWRKSPSQVEVLNDKDVDLMRFYSDLSKITTCNTKQISRDWDSLKKRDGKLTACEFLSEVLCSFGCMRRSKADTEKCLNNAPQFHRYLPQYQARLANTKIHNEDWEKVVRKYDAPDTFFFIDPPYHGTSRGYNHAEDQLSRLAEILPTLKGKFLLTYDDNPEVAAALSKFEQVKVKSNYTLQAGDNTSQGKQLMIANYHLKAALKDTDDIVTLSDFWPSVIGGIGVGLGVHVASSLWNAGKDVVFHRQATVKEVDHCEEARDALAKYEADVKAGHTEAAQYWKGQAEVHGLECASRGGNMNDSIRPDFEERRLDNPPLGDVIVRKYPILGTRMLTYEAWEPDKGDHSTITYYKEEGWKGRVGTKSLPKHLEQLPAYSEERANRVREWQEQEYQRAYKFIDEAFPEIKGKGIRRMGQIDYITEEVLIMTESNLEARKQSGYKPEAVIYTDFKGLVKAYRKAWADKDLDYSDWWDTDRIAGRYPEVGYAGAFIMLWGYALHLAPAQFETHLRYVIEKLGTGSMHDLAKALQDPGVMAEFSVQEVRPGAARESFVRLMIHGKEEIIRSKTAEFGVSGSELYDQIFNMAKRRIATYNKAKASDVTDSSFEAAEQLREIQGQMDELLEQAINIVDEFPGAGDRARAYWYPHIKGNLFKETEFIGGGSMVTMDETIEELQSDKPEYMKDDAGLSKKLKWRDFSEALRIYELAKKQKAAGKDHDEPIKEGCSIHEASPMDQALYMAGLYARHKPEHTTFGMKYSELMQVYLDLAKAIEVDLYGRKEAASEYRDVLLKQHQYAVEVEGNPKSIINRVASSDARQEFQDKESGAYIRLDPDNLNQIHIEYNDQIAESENDEEAVEILTHLRKHKQFPSSAYVFDPLVIGAGLEHSPRECVVYRAVMPEAFGYGVVGTGETKQEAEYKCKQEYSRMEGSFGKFKPWNEAKEYFGFHVEQIKPGQSYTEGDAPMALSPTKLAKDQILDIPSETLSGESYRWGNPTGFTLFLPGDIYCVDRFIGGARVLLSVCRPKENFRSVKHLYAVKRSHLQGQMDKGNIRILGDMQDANHEADLARSQETPAYIDVWKKTITKHYRRSQDMHKGSVRTVKSPGVLVLLGCPKSADWNGKVCSENQALVETHVTKTAEAMREVKEWEKKGVLVNYKVKEEGITPKDSEPTPSKELVVEVEKAMKNAERL